MRNFDEINNLSQDEMMSIEDYFDEMELTDEEKEERKKFAYDMQDIMLFIFALFLTMREYDYMNKQYIVSQLQSRYSEAALNYIAVDDLLDDYIKRFSEEIVETTLKYPDEEYYTSDKRAVNTAANEANTILGHGDFIKAKQRGCKWKGWDTEHDNKVRKTHREVGGLVIPIDEPFVVGGSLMMYAHDAVSFNASMEEIAGCRCTTYYF